MGLFNKMLYAGIGYELFGKWGALGGLMVANMDERNQRQASNGMALNPDLYSGNTVPMDPILQRNLKLAIFAVGLYISKVEGCGGKICDTLNMNSCQEYEQDYEFKQDTDELMDLSRKDALDFGYVERCYLYRIPDEQISILNQYVKNMLEADGSISPEGRDFWNSTWWEFMNSRGIFNEYLSER